MPPCLASRGSAAAFACLATLALITPDSALAQWTNAHPGGGGQIQAVNLDPNRPGRAYLGSDVEGNYRTDNYGQSWTWIGKELVHHMAYSVTIEPGNSDRIYAGTAYGLHVSNNAGENWTYNTAHAQVAGDASVTATIVIDPSNSSVIYTAPSWHVKDDGIQNVEGQTEQPTQQRYGTRRIFKSTDRGASWTALTYESVNGYRHVYTLTLGPTNSQHVYLGAYSGLYRSTNGGGSFTKLPAPAGYTNATCRGADLSPDGQYIYAVFGEEQNNNGVVVNRVLLKPYVARVGVWDWTEISTGIYFPTTSPPNEYWRPIVDPRSGSAAHGLANTHKVLLGCMRSSADVDQGLFEGTFTVAGNGSVSGSWDYAFKRPVGVNLTQLGWNFEFGWNQVNPQVRQYTYTPISWNERKIWLASQQSLYLGDSAHDNPAGYKTSFLVRSTALDQIIGTTPFYRSRGFASTVNFDMDAYANYVAQGMADNVVLESWDDGVSWTQDFAPINVGSGDAVHILRPAGTFANRPPYVLLGAANGPGGGQATNPGTLWVKRVELDPATNGFPPFTALAGGAAGTRGLDGNGGAGPRIYDAASHPANPGLLFLGTLNGLYVTDNVYAMIEQGTGSFTRIDTPPNVVQGWRLYPDPQNQDVLYFAYVANGNRAIKKAVRSGGTWTTTTLASFTNNLRDFAFWRSGNQAWLAYSINDAGNPASPVIYASNNDGASWTPVLTHGDILAAHSEPWFEVNNTQMDFHVLGLVGDGDTLYASTHIEFGKHGYAILKGDLSTSGGLSASWSDWTGTWPITGYMDVPRLWRAAGIDWKGGRYYMAASRGGGLWLRPFTASDTTPPAAPTGLTATAGSQQVSLDWANSPESDFAGYEVYRSTSSGGGFSTINPALVTTSAYTDTGLINGTTYYYRITASDTSGNESGFSATASATPTGGGSGTSVTFVSVAAHDGYLTESSETANTGGNAAAGGTGSAALRVGDTASDQQTRAIVSFDTSGLPDTATLTGATLRLRRGSQQGGDPFATHGQLRVDVAPAFGGDAGLVASDFEAAATATNVAQLSAAPANGDWSVGSLNSTGLGLVNKTGITQFRVYFQLDDDDDGVRDDVGYWPGEAADPANRPELFVNYTTGTVTPTATIAATAASAAEPGNDGQFTVTLSPAPATNVTVAFTRSGTATHGTDYTAIGTSVVVGPAGTATVTIDVNNDALYEGNETVTLTLAAGTGYTIGAGASATVTIADDEPLPVVTVTATDASAAEPSDHGQFTVNTTPAAQAGVTVNLGTTGTATAGSDYTALPSSLFVSSSGSATLAVTVLNDPVAEAAETIVLTAQSGSGYTVGGSASATVTIADDDAVPVEVIFESVGPEDGYVTESNETSNVGGSAAVGGTGATSIRAGDNGSDAQFKGILSFDTSAIPDGATITGVTLRLRRGFVSGTSPFDTHGQCRVDVKTGGFNGNPALEPADFEAAADVTNAGQLSNAAANGDLAEAALNSAGRAAINKTGTTQFRIAFASDDDDDATQDYVSWFPGENNTADNRPQLIVTYTN